MIFLQRAARRLRGLLGHKRSTRRRPGGQNARRAIFLRHAIQPCSVETTFQLPRLFHPGGQSGGRKDHLCHGKGPLPERLERLLTDELTNLSSLEALVYLYNWFSLYQRVKEPESSGNLSHIDLYDFVARFDTLDDVIDSVVELLAPVIPATAGETLPVTNQSFQAIDPVCQ